MQPHCRVKNMACTYWLLTGLIYYLVINCVTSQALSYHSECETMPSKIHVVKGRLIFLIKCCVSRAYAVCAAG